MNKKLWFNVAYFGMIIVVILTCIFLVIYLRSSGKECVADPLQFYIKKVGVDCFCLDKFFP